MAGLALWCGVAQAQLRLEPSEASQCLSVVAGASEVPDYPFEALKNRSAGKVKVLLTFNAPDRAPRVKVEAEEGPAILADAVRDHARNLRVPCLAPGAEPVTLRREYVFDQSLEKVHWSTAEDTADAERSEFLRCITHRSARKRPDYPRLALQNGVRGRVLARLVFSSPDAPPAAEVLASPLASRLQETVEQWVVGLRMPCLQGAPVRVSHTYVFFIEGSADGFKPLTLLQLMRLSKGIRQATLQFDTRQMGCPFEVRLEYWQPYSRNLVGEVGEPNPARRPLLEWLRTVELDLSAQDHNTVFGDTAHITVACLNINLKPKE